MCFSGGSPPPVPDTSGQSTQSNTIGNTASAAAGNLSNYTQAQSTSQNAQTGYAQGQLNNAGQSNLQAGQQGQNFYTNQAIPAAQQNISQSEAWGSPQGVAQAQSDAAASTSQSYDAARLNNQRQLGSYGVDPSQTKSGALNLNANLSQAGAVGNASYTAGQNRQLQGINLTNQATGTALNTSAAGAQYGATGASDLNSSTQLGNQSLATTTQAQLAPSQYMGTALQGYGQSANIASQGYQNSLAGAQYSNTVNTGEASGIGQGVGAVGGLVADYYTAADGGAIPGRNRRPRRYDDGGSTDDGGSVDSPMDQDEQTGAGSDAPQENKADDKIDTGNDSSNIPSATATTSQMEAPTNEGGSKSPVGLTPAQEQQAAQGAFMMGAAKGFGETYKADGGGIPSRGQRPQRFDNGGVAVPNISISPPERVGITSGGAAKGQDPRANGSGSSSGGGMGGMMGGLGSMMGGMGGGGGNSDMGGMDFGTTGGDWGDAASDVDWGDAAADVGDAWADGGQTKQPDFGMPQRSQQGGVPPQTGIPGPWTAANGGPTPNSHGSPHGTFISQGASDGTGIDDQVPAKVSVGEYVIPADVVHAKGKEFFDKLVQRYHTPAQQQRQQMGMR